jgi:hypothetical protein
MEATNIAIENVARRIILNPTQRFALRPSQAPSRRKYKLSPS